MSVPELVHIITHSVMTEVPSERAALKWVFSDFKETFATQWVDIKSPSDLPEFSLSTSQAKFTATFWSKTKPIALRRANLH